ncbi:hypothetical protein DPMN_077931 [Dreissena polymorpha]|uniref:Uncharacterized protein n=1 Tax=Dreissena polymorpha TaxID=45954 RepID=A0A9D4BNR3_DREPO|nr:hypothetical protein DPMN_077931 [Dreissena polymorpha]
MLSPCCLRCRPQTRCLVPSPNSQCTLYCRPPAKRLKAESLLPQVHATDSVPGAQKVIQDFLTAFKCYELLNSTAEMQQGMYCLQVQ